MAEVTGNSILRRIHFHTKAGLWFLSEKRVLYHRTILEDKF